MAVIKKPRKYDVNVEQETAASYYLGMWRGHNKLVEIPSPRETHLTVPPRLRVEQKNVKEHLHALIERLCAKYPSICTDPEILGGTPRINGTRLSVRIILGKLHLLGSIQAIVDSYEPHLSEEQVKDAIAYAQDFMELACAPNEP
jgi:uncharacterized protein (DUF433 family)